MREINLPCYGIVVTITGRNSGTIRSDLSKTKNPDALTAYDAAIDGIESMILAHACAGVNIEGLAYVEGIETAVDAILNNYGH